MSESAQHLQLVNLIIDEVVSMVGKTNRCFIMSDVADGYALSPPHATKNSHLLVTAFCCLYSA